jgi:hypothetical protein
MHMNEWLLAGVAFGAGVVCLGIFLGCGGLFLLGLIGMAIKQAPPPTMSNGWGLGSGPLRGKGKDTVEVSKNTVEVSKNYGEGKTIEVLDRAVLSESDNRAERWYRIETDQGWRLLTFAEVQDAWSLLVNGASQAALDLLLAQLAMESGPTSWPCRVRRGCRP